MPSLTVSSTGIKFRCFIRSVAARLLVVNGVPGSGCWDSCVSWDGRDRQVFGDTNLGGVLPEELKSILRLGPSSKLGDRLSPARRTVAGIVPFTENGPAEGIVQLKVLFFCCRVDADHSSCDAL